MPGAVAPSAFEQQVQKILSYAGPITQILFWIVVAIILFLAWRDFHKLVARHLAKETSNAQSVETNDTGEVDLEEFVD